MTPPNFKKGIGNLATDRYDFQKHVNGSDFRHKADQIDLNPNIDGYNTVQNALTQIIANLTPPTVPDATASVKGIIKLSGDIGGSASSVSVLGLRGYPVSNIPPTASYVLTWDGSIWKAASPDGYVRTITSNLVADTGVRDNIILVDTTSSRTITLPAPTSGRLLTIKDKTGNASANPISLIRHAAEMIEGVAATRLLATDWGVWRVCSDSINWFLL